MFLRDDQVLHLAGGTAARAIGAPALARAPLLRPSALDRLRDKAATIDWTPDLGANIGSRDWWRGLLTCTMLCAATWSLGPTDRPLTGVVDPPLAGPEWGEARAQGMTPLGLGSGTGRRMAANDLVRPLAEAPERPSVELMATLGDGDAFDRVLQRAGVSRPDAEAAAALLSQAVRPSDVQPGTRIRLTLGRRASRAMPRPLDGMRLRARLDLDVSIGRIGGRLAMTPRPIAVDRTPLRIQGLVGSSLYRSARAAGAPPKAVEQYLRAIATRLSVGRDIGAADMFDLVIERERAATGEVRLGRLLLAGVSRDGRATRLVRFSSGGGDGRDEWFDAAGRIERRGFMGMPVAGRVSSSFGFRTHPILGLLRLHKGMDIAAPHGAPIRAAIDGVVTFAGRSGGYGNFVKLRHGGNIESGYGHMSRIAVRSGERVSRGEVIGYVGSTGMSTGPHLHWEVWKNGRPVNPRSISYDQVDMLSGERLRAFEAEVARLLSVPVGR